MQVALCYLFLFNYAVMICIALSWFLNPLALLSLIWAISSNLHTLLITSLTSSVLSKSEIFVLIFSWFFLFSKHFPDKENVESA